MIASRDDEYEEVDAKQFQGNSRQISDTTTLSKLAAELPLANSKKHLLVWEMLMILIIEGKCTSCKSLWHLPNVLKVSVNVNGIQHVLIQ